MYIEENCIFSHEGKDFEAGGAVVTSEMVIAYPDTETSGLLKDWHGKVIGTCRVLSSWTILSCVSDRMYSYECLVEGVRYVGRGCGKGMVLRAKRSPRQPDKQTIKMDIATLHAILKSAPLGFVGGCGNPKAQGIAGGVP